MSCSLIWCVSARVYDACTTGPSAIGSLYGMPTSHIEQPRRSSSRMTSAVNAKSGAPAVTNGMNALRFWRRRSAKSWSMRDIQFSELDMGALTIDIASVSDGDYFDD